MESPTLRHGQTRLDTTTMTRLRAGLPGDYGGTTGCWWIPIVGPLIGAVVGIVIYDFFIGHVLEARTTMLLTPEPGLAPPPTTDAAAAVAGPVTAEDSADSESLAAEGDRAA
ncbi:MULTISPECIES: hypothetical protein [Mycobacterium]|uniref:hypothetical protein n=1 Tax=Mycobacterium TaxID=1763 RepID=UPI00197C7A22|nr:MULTISPECIES: hypothetical protein [Mycobacterium]MDM4141461.1 hypothetical protein [Mycobacterium sp. FLAC0960]